MTGKTRARLKELSQTGDIGAFASQNWDKAAAEIYVLKPGQDKNQPMAKILYPGRNCWRIAHAGRAAFLVDGEAYFTALADALERARESILIAGWDFDSRIHLTSRDRYDGSATELGALLNALVARRRNLHAHVLVWDFAMIYALERESLPIYGSGWRTHARAHFRMDGVHPLGASHHQKIVVVDDSIAFAGGLDLTKRRWDTPQHLVEDPRRIDPDGYLYPPHHDVQMAVGGEAARLLGDLVRERWRRATGERLRPPSVEDSDAWPHRLAPDLADVAVAISRTEPSYGGRSEIREVESLHRDAIAAARRLIYMENMYFTSAAVGDALAARLKEEEGPEIVLVLCEKNSGWLEEATMGVLRARLLKRLRAADRFGRLRVYYPRVAGLIGGCMCVHSKVLVVDDVLVRIGSANLNNRSMGLDTECDLAIEANQNPAIAKSIAGFQNRLLGEHLGATADKVAQTFEATGSLVRTIDALRGAERTLETLDGEVARWLDQMIPDSAILDPERPIAPEKLIYEFVPPPDRKNAGHSLIRVMATLVFLFALAAAWRWTPLSDWFDIDTVTAWQASLQETSTAPLIVLTAYVIGGLIVFPVTVLIVATILAFGPLSGSVYSLAGCVASAAVVYGIGYVSGRQTIRRIAGPRLNRLNRLILRHGIIAVASLRLLPIAPFSVVNLVAGASRIRFRDFILGTLIGMAPGILGITLFERQFENAIRYPGLESLGILAAVIATIAAAIAWLRRQLDSPNYSSLSGASPSGRGR